MMNKNDQIILKNVLEQRKYELAPDFNDTDFFEIFTAEQVLKDYDLSYDELGDGIVNGGGDGGIDGIYALVNGELLKDDSDFTSLKKNIDLKLIVIQSKVVNGFTEESINKLEATTRDLFNLSSDLKQFKSVYNELLLKIVQRFRDAYTLLAARFPALTIAYYYATTGMAVDHKVRRKTDALGSTVKALFSSALFQFHFLTATDLLLLARKEPASSFSITLAENPISTGQGGFVCLVRLYDFYGFISDNNVIRKNIFEANVRDYQGKTEVNDEIQRALEIPSSEDFWWLNNGVTVVAEKANLSGKTLTVEDPQIVNGLQTSTEIHHFFSRAGDAQDKRNLLVRIIVPQDLASRDRIIKATNSQTRLPVASLRATDKIQRDIEEYFLVNDLYYDRRKNYYKNLGKPVSKIVSIEYLAQAVLAIALQEPDSSRARPSSLLKNDKDYDRIFNTKHPIILYLQSMRIMKQVESFLRSGDCELDAATRNNLKFYLAMYVTAVAMKFHRPNIELIASVEIGHLTNQVLSENLATIYEVYRILGASDQVAKGAELVSKLKAMLSTTYSPNLFS